MFFIFNFSLFNNTVSKSQKNYTIFLRKNQGLYQFYLKALLKIFF